jgi:hypothetical protein
MGKPSRRRTPSAKAAAQLNNQKEGAARQQPKFKSHKASRGTTNAVLVRAAKAGGSLVAERFEIDVPDWMIGRVSHVM